MNSKEFNTKEYADLFEAILSLKSTDEAQKFFRDLCTLEELQSMSERWQMAKLLAKDTPYRKVSELTKSSTATVTRVAQWLHHGMGGYKLVLERLNLLNHQS